MMTIEVVEPDGLRASLGAADVHQDTLEGFRISERLYAGPRSTLYRAIRGADGQRVILKTARHVRATQRDLADFSHEFSVLARLAGAPAVSALDLVTQLGRPWLVLEDLGGQALDRIASRYRTPERVLRLAVRIAEALAGVHHRGVVHRDIKPEHVIVMDDESVRFTGFRVASLLRVEAANTVVGTLAYMAPEQTGRMNRPVDKRADLYAFGVVLYELLTGRLPFEGTDPLEWMHAHIAQTPVPPEQIAPSVPRSASAIVLKLLSKQAEDRYHGATGLLRDLERCASNLARGEHAAFPLASDDAPEELRVSRRLYGRELEVAQLVTGFERSRASGSCVVSLVAGYSGVGKTAVVSALYQPIARERGRFIGGKFDQYKRDIPYATIVQAFRELIRDILSSGDASLAEWRTRLVGALGNNGRVITNVIPEVELVVGPQPFVPELAPTEAQNRFESVLRAFVRVFARHEHPLVLFLDDLQWADGATLDVLRLLAGPGQVPYLHLVLAYRDNEVDAGHPFQHCIDGMRVNGSAVDLVAVRELRPDDMTALVADTLLRRGEEPAVEALAQLIRAKAGGNPFFVNELLQAFDARGLFLFDREQGGWSWNEAAMRAADVTDNVVDLLVERLRGLEDRTRRALEIASCFGSRFRLGTLAAVLDADCEEAFGALFSALDQGLIVSVDDAIGDEQAFRFHHDRIQQAAYSLLSDARRVHTHLRIGRYMRDSLRGSRDALLFDVVKHLDQGASLIDDAGERRQLIGLNLAAARRAKSAIAWEPARLYLESAVSLFAGDAWSTHHRDTFEVMRELAECEFLTGHFDRSERRFDELRLRAETRADRAATAALQVRLYVLTGRYDEALSVGISELAFLGELLPEAEVDLGPAIAAERARLASNLDGRDVRSIVELPLAIAEEKIALISLLASLPPAIYSRRPTMFPIFAMRIVSLSIEHGNCEASCFGYSMLAMIFAAAEGDADRAFALSEASIALNQRLSDPKLLGPVLHIHANHIAYWKRSYDEARTLLARAYTACMDVGDLMIAGYVAFMGAWLSLERGQPLAAAEQELGLVEGLARGTRSDTAQAAVAVQRQFVRALAGQTLEPTSLSSASFDADDARKRIATAGNDTAVAMHDVLRAMLAFYHGRFGEADAWLASSASNLSAAFCLPIEMTWTFFDGLTAAALWTDAEADVRAALLARVRAAELRLRDVAQSSPANFAAKHALLVAECARLDSRPLDALRGYEVAASEARRSGLLSTEAAVMQAAIRFVGADQLTRAARGWIEDYGDVLRQWGATSLFQLHEAAHPPRRSGAEAGQDGALFHGPPDQLDALTAIKLSQALSREFLVEGLTQTALKIVLENAGAERAVLMISTNGSLAVAGAASVHGSDEGTAALPHSIVRYVERTRTHVVLVNAVEDTTFGRDPHILGMQSRSVLCLPIVLRGQLVAVLYLENTRVTGAFSVDRLALLEVIGTQLAISLENARLFRDREDRATELARQKARDAQRDDLYRHFMQAVFPIAIFRGPEHVIELANTALLAGWGRTPAVVGLPLLTALPEILGQPFPGRLDEVYRTGIPYNGEAELARLPSGLDGALRDVYFTYAYAPLRAADGAIEGILVSAFEVTSQVVARQDSERTAALLQAAQAELSIVAERLGTAQRAANIGIFEWKLESDELYWSPELYALLGLGAGEIPPSSDAWNARVLEADRATAWAVFRDACAEKRETYEVEIRLVQPDASLRTVRISNRLFYVDDRPARLVGAAVDIEELRRVVKAEREAREAAQQHVRFNEMFTGMLGHDLRNPLSAIMTAADLIAHPDCPKDKIDRASRRIVSSGSRMARMIDQLLDFTRIRTGGGIPLTPVLTDVATLCERTREEIEAAVPGARVSIEQQGDTVAEIDEDRLLQVVSNLVGNAAIHGFTQTPVRVMIDGSSGSGVTISVWNSGTIAPDLIPILFEPFRGGKNKGSKGLGLGLYITQQIVKAHQGRLDLSTSEESGTRFEFWLPRTQEGRRGIVNA